MQLGRQLHAALKMMFYEVQPAQAHREIAANDERQSKKSKLKLADKPIVDRPTDLGMLCNDERTVSTKNRGAMKLRPLWSLIADCSPRQCSRNSRGRSCTHHLKHDVLASLVRHPSKVFGTASVYEGGPMGTIEGCSSDSDDDLYTRSVSLQEVRGAVTTRNTTTEISSVKNKCVQEKVDVVVLDDDESLDLPDSDCAFPTKAKQSRRKRVEQLAQKELLELEEILSEPVIQVVAPCPKRTRRIRTYDRPGNTIDIDIVSDDATPSSVKTCKQSGETSATSDVIELDKEVNLFVTVFLDQDNGKTGRFMSILHDEPFDKLRPEFAKELKCNQLDVMIHVNNVDAGPGDTPDSMGLDIEKLALVNVFCLKPNSNSDEDLSSDPNFIPVRCIFESGRPRCVYLKLTETFADAKKRIEKALQLSSGVERLVFDNDVLDDSDTPTSIDMEAEDVIEIHLKKSL
ncbi:hypothetical protein RB195_006291 [Necator americanus]|uniref:Ubiquitin-like domain-containing protein n=1 Tax=Necator americanus TaxID=51031 RepID=A0ABR1BVR1_NECAM